MPLNLSFGYGSRFDTDTWGIDLCDDCIEDFVTTLKYPPTGFFQYPETLIMRDYTDSEIIAVFEEWKKDRKINWIDKITTKEMAEEISNHFNLSEADIELLKNKKLL